MLWLATLLESRSYWCCWLFGRWPTITQHKTLDMVYVTLLIAFPGNVLRFQGFPKSRLISLFLVFSTHLSVLSNHRFWCWRNSKPSLLLTQLTSKSPASSVISLSLIEITLCVGLVNCLVIVQSFVWKGGCWSFRQFVIMLWLGTLLGLIDVADCSVVGLTPNTRRWIWYMSLCLSHLLVTF